ncbi:MAG: hypothetical protein ABT10_03030 [Novosphingobium sp. SCN 63-17]|nr:MAG: hypothetical protein ABT10_03030 [Novosphingobium sp. SCN 63-17]OJX92911.1 MAG: hypothetical protein BGP00_23630 [Novosphingobium sp. 63-713]
MPQARPTLSTLRDQVQSDIDADLPGLDTLLRYANLRALGAAAAGLADGLYGYLDYAARQTVPFTARDEFLAGWGALKGAYIKPATKSGGGQTAFSVNGPATIPAGTQLTRGDGTSFVTTADAASVGPTIMVNTQAVVAGAAGNTELGAAMFLASGITNVNLEGTVTTALTGGADIENEDEFLARVLSAYQATPAGGSPSDYENWALEVPGVTRAWCVPRGYGVGTVVVLFMMDDVRAAEGGFPQGTSGLAASDDRDVTATGDQLVLANYLATLQPADPRVYAMAPVANSVNFTIAGLGSSPSTTTQDAINAALAAALTTYGVVNGTTHFDKINAALASVSAAAGAVITGMTCTAGSIAPGPIGNVVSNTFALPRLGTVSYV